MSPALNGEELVAPDGNGVTLFLAQDSNLQVNSEISMNPEVSTIEPNTADVSLVYTQSQNQ